MRTLEVWCGFLILIAGLLLKDYLKKRKKPELIPLSVFIPCYNDAESIETTIKSLYASYPKELLEVFIINDKSTDSSLEILQKLNKIYPFNFLNNEKNLGKSATLNQASLKASHETFLILDADMEINKKNLVEMLRRKTGKVVAVSCPYLPLNKGFRATMQAIEYVMMSFLQASYNIQGAIGIWGGCILVDKKPFLEVGQFSHQAIIEDMDLAFKLTKSGYKVEQALIPVKTYVPDTFKSRRNQKIRRGSGGTQCFIKYWNVWIKNPLHILFLSFFCLSIGASAWSFVKDWLIIEPILEISHSWTNIFFVLSPKWRAITLFTKLWFTLFSLPYVIPLIKNWKESWKILLVIPFSLIYIPLFSFVNVIAAIKMLFIYKKLEHWKTRGR